jgi:ankyrin repeat protein
MDLQIAVRTGRPLDADALDAADMAQLRELAYAAVDTGQTAHLQTLLWRMGTRDVQLIFERAVSCGHVECTDIVLRHGRVHVNALCPSRLHPLHHACAFADNRMVARLLAEEDLDPNVPFNGRDTPLHLALYTGHEATVEALAADLRVDVNACGPDLDRPLHVACARQSVRSVRALLARPDLDVNAESRNASALWFAVRATDVDVIKLLLPVANVACVRRRDHSSLLHCIASVPGPTEQLLSQLLLDPRVFALLQAPDAHGLTPLDIAVRARRPRIAATLINAGTPWRFGVHSDIDEPVCADRMLMTILCMRRCCGHQTPRWMAAMIAATIL